jgi:hypothetical protein
MAFLLPLFPSSDLFEFLFQPIKPFIERVEVSFKAIRQEPETPESHDHYAKNYPSCHSAMLPRRSLTRKMILAVRALQVST